MSAVSRCNPVGWSQAKKVFQYDTMGPVRAIQLPPDRLLLVGNVGSSGNFGGHPLVHQGGGDVGVAVIQL